MARPPRPRVPDGATQEGAWIDACDLEEGDELLVQDGRIVHLQSISTIDTQTMVYNFEVEELHTYAVGDMCVLVHNTGCLWDSDDLADSMTLRKRLGDFFESNGVSLKENSFFVHGASSRMLDINFPDGFFHNGADDLFTAVDLRVVKHFALRAIRKFNGGEVDGVLLVLPRRISDSLISQSSIYTKKIDDMPGLNEIILTPDAARAINKFGTWTRLGAGFFRR